MHSAMVELWPALAADGDATLAERVRQRSNPDVWDRLVVLIEKTHEADVAETTSRSWATGQSARDQLRLRFARTSRWRLIQ